MLSIILIAETEDMNDVLCAVCNEGSSKIQTFCSIFSLCSFAPSDIPLAPLPSVGGRLVCCDGCSNAVHENCFEKAAGDSESVGQIMFESTLRRRFPSFPDILTHAFFLTTQSTPRLGYSPQRRSLVLRKMRPPQ